MKLITKHHNNLLASHFGIKKTRELIAENLISQHSNRCEILYQRMRRLFSIKAMRHKLYGDLQSFSVLTHQWKDLSMNFVTGLAVSTN